MLWAERWRRLSQRIERWPLWVQLVVIPPLAPPVAALAAACLCPRTATVAGAVLVVSYGALLHAQVLTWPEVGRQFGRLYLMFVVAALVGILDAASTRVINRLFPDKPAGPRPGPPGPASSEAGSA